MSKISEERRRQQEFEKEIRRLIADSWRMLGQIESDERKERAEERAAAAAVRAFALHEKRSRRASVKRALAAKESSP